MPKTSQYDLLAILLILLAAACAYLFIRPTLGNLKSLNIELGAKSQELQKTEDKLAAVRVLKSEFEANPDALKRLKIALPAGQAMPDLVAQLETLVGRNSLDLTSLQPSLVAEKGQAAGSINLAVKGGYSNLVSFLANVENNIRPLRVKTIGLSGTPKDNSSVVSANLVLEVFTPSK